jgi:hypothetical protein
MDSYAAQGEMMRAQPPTPPAHLEVPEDAMPHWWAIVRARAYDAWTETDLEHAANLACCFADSERLRRELRLEGDVLINAKGTPVANPKHQILDVLSRRSVSLSKLIHVHAEATSGKSRDEVKRNKKQRELVETRDKTDDLIAKPMQ